MTASRLVCFGCGHRVPPGEPLPFRCPIARPDDDVDHLLRRQLDPEALGDPDEIRALFASDEPNPFLAYRRLFHAYQKARAGGWSDADYRRLVERIDRAIAAVAGRGFRVTPWVEHQDLAGRLGIEKLWAKDETGNVGDTHKARHLAGLLLWLEIARALHPGRARYEAPLAIASCGNAALAAAIVARAAERKLTLFVPANAESGLFERFEALGAATQICHEHPAGGGDPAYQGFRRAVAQGALPFAVQGPDNGLTMQGGATLAWEIVAELARQGETIDRLLIQVGGGALAAATLQGLNEARQLGVLERVPMVHGIQTGASPLARAYRIVAAEIAEGWTAESGEAAPSPGEPAEFADWLRDRVPAEFRRAALERAAQRRSHYMWPWEGPLESVASAILDDETYDWLMVVEGMLATGGWPVTVSEPLLVEAREAARETTGKPVTASGSAGLAGAMAMARDGELGAAERVGVLFTGVERGPIDWTSVSEVAPPSRG